MIGAMPAVAVRHERRRAEKRSGGGRRPSQLPLQVGRPGDPEATPSPDRYRERSEFYVCGKLALLHAVVCSFLLGVVILVVGLVQLSPGAEAAKHRYYLLGCGAALIGIGTLGAILRCICLQWHKRKYHHNVEVQAPAATKNGVSVVDHPVHTHGHAHEKTDTHKVDDKPKLKTQASVGREIDTLIKQPSAASDT